MAQTITFNGVVYTVPDVGDTGWGQNLTNYFVGIPQGCLQKTGGVFTLTADVDFGASFGLLPNYIKSRASNPATAGIMRLAVTDLVEWRNNANNANLTLGINASDQLIFNGTSIISNGITALTGDVVATGPGIVAATIQPNVVDNTKLRQSAAVSVIGNSTGSTANVSDISASADGQVLQRASGLLSFALLNNSNLTGSAGITNANLAQMANGTVKGNFSGGSATPSDVSPVSVPTVSTIAFRDINGNTAFNNAIENYTTTVTANGITTLSVSSTKQQFFTGTLGQNIILPDATTLPQVGFMFRIVNLSSAGLTLKDNGGNVLLAIPAVAWLNITAKSIASSNGSWDLQYSVNNPPGTVTSVAMTVPNIFSISGSPITSSGTLALTLANQTAGTFFCGPQTGSAAAPTFKLLQVPVTQNFTSGSGTFNPTSGALWMEVFVQAGGGGGGATGTTPGAASAGGNSTFSTITANGGAAAPSQPSYHQVGGAGGTATGGTLNVTGGNGGGNSSTVASPGGSGGNSRLGNGGPGMPIDTGQDTTTGNSATGFGGGGGGPANNGASVNGSGGGGGGFSYHVMASASVSYSVGSGGAGGTAGTGGAAGGAGTAGIITVIEHFQ